jgi:hypothetical protein
MIGEDGKMIEDDADRVRERAEFFDELARRITDARVREALKAMAHEYRVTAEQLPAAALIGPFVG